MSVRTYLDTHLYIKVPIYVSLSWRLSILFGQIEKFLTIGQNVYKRNNM